MQIKNDWKYRKIYLIITRQIFRFSDTNNPIILKQIDYKLNLF